MTLSLWISRIHGIGMVSRMSGIKHSDNVGGIFGVRVLLVKRVMFPKAFGS